MSTLSVEKALRVAGLSATKVASADSGSYAFNDRNATVISYVRAQVSGADPHIKQACEEHARFWGVEAECQAAMDKIAAWKPAELDDSDHLFVIDGQPKYAAYDRDSVGRAALAFYEHRDHYPLEMRKQAAVRLLNRASQHAAHLPDFINTYLHKAAGFGYPSEDTVDEMLTQRLNRAGAKFAAEKTKLAEALTSLSERADLRYDDDYVKTAMSVLEDFDAHTGLTDHYEAGVSLPEELIDSQLTTYELEKLAGMSKMAVQLTNGRTVDVSSLDPSCLAAVDPALAKMAADQLAEVLPTLPRGDADLLVRLI